MRCKLCGKEINEGAYCCKEHDEKYKNYINKRDKKQGKMVFGFMGIMISYLIVMLIGCKLNINRYTYKAIKHLFVMVGLEIILCPYTKQQTLNKIGVLKAIFLCRIIGLCFIIAGIIFAII